MLKPKKLNIYRLGTYEANEIIGMYRFPWSIHKDFKARKYQCR